MQRLLQPHAKKTCLWRQTYIRIEGRRWSDEQRRSSVVEYDCVSTNQRRVRNLVHKHAPVGHGNGFKNLLIHTEGDATQVQRVISDLLTFPRVTKDSSWSGCNHQLFTDRHKIRDPAFNFNFEGLRQKKNNFMNILFGSDFKFRLVLKEWRKLWKSGKEKRKSFWLFF